MLFNDLSFADLRSLFLRKYFRTSRLFGRTSVWRQLNIYRF